MHISQLKESKFLRKEDCGNGILVTIDHLSQQNVSQSGAPEEMKWCLNLKEDILPMVLNSTNLQLIAQITKSEETDLWAGHKLVLFNDPAVSYAGKITGGIRVRAPRGRAAAPAQPAPAAKPATRPAPVQPADPYDAQPEAPEGLEDPPF